ncbi:MAG: DUF456 domain-containing protein [Pirellulales bacterium]|nr:DUF456 domain-containing protein [Pirellulales bacterium]
MLDLLWVVLFVVALVAGWVMVLLAMPGTWLIVGCAALYAWLVRDDAFWDVGWPVVAVLLGLAVLGEIAETVAGALGVARAGGSRRGMLLALLGSLLGAIVGIVVGVPVPVVGQLIAAVVFAGIGATIGAILGEQWKGRTLEASLNIGLAAFWGRVLGTLSKVIVASAMVVVALAALVTRL